MHIAYRKFSSQEKKQLAGLLDAELDRHQDDTHLLNIVEILKKSAGDDYQEAIREEVHSIYGVEFSDLSDKLEEHYEQFFLDRSKVVQLHESGGLEKRVRKMDELSWQRTQLEEKLFPLQNQLESYEKAGSLNDHQSELSEYNTMVNQYNGIVKEANYLFSEIEVFYKLINPGYSPAQTK